MTFSAATAGLFATFMIQIRDDIGNNMNIPPKVAFILKLNDFIEFGSSYCKIDSKNVIYSSFQRISNTSAVVAYTYNISGSVAMQGALLQPGGLSVSVLDGFISDQSSIIPGAAKLVYSALDTNFGTGRIGIDFTKFNFGSTTLLFWKGFLVPLFSEYYTFHLSSNGCTSVNISSMVMFSCSSGVTKSLKLRANELHDVSITYRHSNGIPSLVLFWQSTSQQREIIPSSCW